MPAFAVALLASAGFGALFDRLVLWPLRNSAPLAKLVASLGLLLTIQALAIQRFGIYGEAAPNVLPAGPGDVLHIFGGIVPTDRVWLAVIVVVLTGMLMAVYKYTRFGVATRAAAENQPAAALTGLAPQTISTVNTMAAFMLAGLLGILVAPTSQLDPATIPLAVIPALGAALIARFTSFGIAAGFGILMGIIQSELIYLQTKPWFPESGGVSLPGVADLVYFLIIVVVLVFQGKALPERGTLTEARLPRAPAAKRILVPSLVAAAVCTVSFFVLPFDWRSATILTLIGAVVCLSLVVITGFVGQVSLFQVGLGGIAGLRRREARARPRDRLPARSDPRDPVRDGVRRRRRAARLPRARRQPRDPDGGRHGRDRAVRAEQRHLGRGRGERHDRPRAEALRDRHRPERDAGSGRATASRRPLSRWSSSS